MRFQNGLLLLMFAACSADDPASHALVILPEALHQTGLVPGGGNAPGTIAAATSFTFTGTLAPGSASFVNSTVTDDQNNPPPSFGTGGFDITINGTAYTSSAQSAALMFTDPDNNGYVELASFVQSADATTVSAVAVIVKQSDFVVGGSVALDGVDRLALFATGLATDSQPAVVGAAVSGTVTFSSGSLVNGSAVSAAVVGDFGQIEWDGGGGGGSGGGGGAIVAGTYALAISASAQVYCDGSLVGHEAAFAGVTAASLHLDSGAVTVAVPTAASVTLDGSVIASDFGVTPLVLDSNDQPSGVFAATTSETGSGPYGTAYVGRYLAFDGGSATSTFISGSAGGGYTTADQSGTCTVAFAASLSH
jgi:hypothetical protein